jgi:hypothetical protein
MAVTELRVRGLTQLAIADNATTPNPGSEGWAWSTTLDCPVYWNGTNWNASRGITVGTTAPPAPFVNQLWLDTN